MYNNYKVVVNTAAGRRRYMQYLIPFVVASDMVDRYDIWVNTHNGADIEFFRQIAAKFPKVNLIWQPDGIVDGNKSINAFYRGCVEENTIYFKLDDDIVWMEPGAIEKMVRFRVDNPEYFLVTPLVINNALTTYFLQVHGKIKLDRYYNSSAAHPILWESGEFAKQLHQWFLNKRLYCDDYQSLHLNIGEGKMGMTRFSINAILWFGEEMKRFDGIVPGDDEEFLSCIYPTMHGMCNCWNGGAIMAHFAFFTQREQLDKAGIFEQYGDYLSREWEKDEKMRSIHNTIQAIVKYVHDNEGTLTRMPSPYKKADVIQKGILRKVYGKMPLPVRKAIKNMAISMRATPNYIES